MSGIEAGGCEESTREVGWVEQGVRGGGGGGMERAAMVGDS